MPLLYLLSALPTGLPTPSSELRSPPEGSWEAQAHESEKFFFPSWHFLWGVWELASSKGDWIQGQPSSTIQLLSVHDNSSLPEPPLTYSVLSSQPGEASLPPGFVLAVPSVLNSFPQWMKAAALPPSPPSGLCPNVSFPGRHFLTAPYLPPPLLPLFLLIALTPGNRPHRLLIHPVSSLSPIDASSPRAGALVSIVPCCIPSKHPVSPGLCGFDRLGLKFWFSHFLAFFSLDLSFLI